MTLHLSTRQLYDSQGMEDGPDSGTVTVTSNASTPRAATPNNGGIEMANFPTTETRAPATPPKINGESVLQQPQPSPVTGDYHASPRHSPQTEETPQENENETNKPTEDNVEAGNGDDEEAEDEDGSSSDCDHLVIDEEVKPKRRKKVLNSKVKPPEEKEPVETVDAHNSDHEQTQQEDEEKSEDRRLHDEELQQRLSEQYIHSNPYFAESIFELTNHYNTTPVSEGIPKLSLKKVGNRYAKKVRGKNGKPKLRDYAQYLGLQPTVQFKCSKCGSAGFESLQLLNEHLVNCTAIAPMHPPPPPSNNTTNFKVTRKVFLCSACGTYYENWNLFLHMREVHKRFICLYCLGMFPHAEKLAAHLVHKHNCAPAKHVDEMEFAGAHREPCFLMCCDCQMVFTEQDYVTRHKCIGDNVKESDRATVGGQDVQVTTNQLVIETSATKDGELSVTGTVELASVDEQARTGDLVDNNKADKTDESVSDAECARDVSGEESDLQKTTLGENKQLNVSDEQNIADEDDSNAEDNDPDDDDENETGDKMQVEDDSADDEVPHDERKVPKVTLKFARMYPPGDESESHENKPQQKESDHSENENDEHSDDSDKDTMEAGSSETKLVEDDAHHQLQASSQEGSEVDVEGNTSQEELDIENYTKPTLEAENNRKRVESGSEAMEKSQDEKSVDLDSSQGEQTAQTTQDTEESKELSQEEQDLDAKEEVSTLATAGSEIAINEIELDQPLDKFDIKLLLQKCLQATIPTCLYCNHARKIAVNGKQLGLHAIAEHRYSSIVKSITAEELIPESFNNRIQESLEELDKMYFALEDVTPSFTHMFECFQCRYSSPMHKELYMHNRKLHAKALLICTMCKTSFYSYSELLCHQCPGVYSSDRDRDVYFRCCMCVSDEFPSAFRLVVHLRKAHHVCDVCLELCHNQMRLSNHVWKHKLHHLCYRCGIAYRNKQDITRHLFWKHGTESVQCKKCLQKKWPHMYHFCQPPASFACDQCTVTVPRASKLRVHKRLHSNEFPHACTEENCTEKFISKRLLFKHEKKVHREPEEPVKMEEEPEMEDIVVEEIKVDRESPDLEKKVDVDETKEEKEEKPKPKVDVYDLPELNLSESDSDSEDESTKSTSIFKPENDISSSILMNPDDLLLETSQDDILKLSDDLDLGLGSDDISRYGEGEPSPGMDNAVLDIWNNFKNYQENIAKTILTDVSKDDDDFPAILTDIPPVLTLEEALRDHDYCPRTTDTLIEQEHIPGLQPIVQPSPANSADHDYCSGSGLGRLPEKKEEVDAKGGVLPSSKALVIENFEEPPSVKSKSKESSDSSSDSDSSSCTCGSNCSCSSGSSSSSSSDSSESDSSSEEGRRRQQVRREKRRGRKPKAQLENVPASVTKANQKHENDRILKEEAKASSSPTAGKTSSTPKEAPIRDSDLSTTESDTDEEFYDKEPQKIANKLLAEKREKLMQMAAHGTYVNGALIDSRPATPSMTDESNQQSAQSSTQKEPKKSKKSKSKKKKRKKSSKRQSKMAPAPPAPYRHQQQPQVAPLTLTLPKSAPVTPVYNSPLNISNHNPMSMSINNTPTGQSPLFTDNENSGTRASKRRRVPNKFYGYSSDEENEKVVATGAPNIKFRKIDLPSPKPPMIVPPITIKTTPVVNPISIRMSANPDEMRVQPLRLPLHKKKRSAPKTKARKVPPQPSPVQQPHNPPIPQSYPAPPPVPRVRMPPPPAIRQRVVDNDSGSDSNSSTSDADEEPTPAPTRLPPTAFSHSKPNAPTTALYCYCRCPYDEVSEMIGCDSDDCAIEWFHFECVGIMVPPKGQWFCPDCRKRKQQRREMLQQNARVK